MNKILVSLFVFLAVGVTTNIFADEIPPFQISGAFVSSSSLKGAIDNVTHCRTDSNTTALEIRGSGCNGTCNLMPKQEYEFEVDFVASSSTEGVHLKVDLYVFGVMLYIIDQDLPDSALVGCQLYTIRYALTTTDALAGQNMLIYVRLFHIDKEYYTELCTSFPLHVEYD